MDRMETAVAGRPPMADLRRPGDASECSVCDGQLPDSIRGLLLNVQSSMNCLARTGARETLWTIELTVLLPKSRHSLCLTSRGKP